MSSMISMITERVASLEASLRALEAEQADLRSQNQRLAEEVDALRGQNEELSQQCDALGRESTELRRAASESQTDTDRWRAAYEGLCSDMQAALDRATAQPDEGSATVASPGEVTAAIPLPAPTASEPATAHPYSLESAVPAAPPLVEDSERTTPVASVVGQVEPLEAAETTSQAAPGRGISEIVAYPFERFAELRAFQEAVRAIPGTRDVRLLHFDKGTLELRVEYEGTVPLELALRSMEGFIGSISIDASGRLVYRLQSRDPQV